MPEAHYVDHLHEVRRMDEIEDRERGIDPEVRRLLGEIHKLRQQLRYTEALLSRNRAGGRA